MAVLPPRQGEATVERIAINAVMAGCRPEYLPVIITAVEALADPLFNLDSIQATTHPVAPLIIVNGPIAKEVGINAGYNAFGQGFRANLTIGRAIRLLLMNVGGGLPGTGDRATQGSPAKIAYCVAENEAANPWEPLHVEHGFPADTSVVTAIACEGPHNIQDHFSYTGLGILKVVAGAMGQAGSNNILAGGHPLLSLGPEHAATIARDGFTKRQVKEFLFEHARFPLARLGDEYRTHLISARGQGRARYHDPRGALPRRRDRDRGRRRGQALLLAADLRRSDLAGAPADDEERRHTAPVARRAHPQLVGGAAENRSGPARNRKNVMSATQGADVSFGAQSKG